MGASVKVAVRTNGEGLVSHAGAALIAETADRLGLTSALDRALVALREQTSRHSPGAMVQDLAVMLADGGDARCDLGALRDHEGVVRGGGVGLDAYRLLERIPQTLGRLSGSGRRARRPERGGAARGRGWRRSISTSRS